MAAAAPPTVRSSTGEWRVQTPASWSTAATTTAVAPTRSSFPPAADDGYGRKAFDRELLAGIPIDPGAFFDVMLTVEGLLDLTCSAVARQFSWPLERLRELFHVVDDFATGEEEIRREMSWAFDDNDD
uniref:SKP1 component dimerisation domain-containing protein n=1 Tax=Oryza meridionalis TaxID=40149 RepID=A0A0E0CI77_9ORYZ